MKTIIIFVGALLVLIFLRLLKRYKEMPPLLYGTVPPKKYKQNIDDVLYNEGYMRIDMNDCCQNSSINHLYIKDSCVTGLYNLFNTKDDGDNNKDYGCLVLGRWVRLSDSGKCNVTLEEVLLPGDDSVINENEVNFGYKIKIYASNALRKLRMETCLDYDITCWIRIKHDGGVCFDDMDNRHQMSMRGLIYPYFLTAIMIDGTSTNGKLGIFTFKSDEPKKEQNEDQQYAKPTRAMNRREDLTKTFTLKEWNDWATRNCSANVEQLKIYLTIECSEHEMMEAIVEDPNRTIRQQVDNIVRIFNLKVKTDDGNKITYLMGLMRKNSNDEPELLPFEDEDGHELTLKDFDVESGDHLSIFSPVLYGSAITWPIPVEKPSQLPDKPSDGE